MIKFIATDLDRTLIPNGKQKYDGSMDLFEKIIKRKDLKLAYITGRDIELIKGAIKKYNIPVPDYAIASVGTRIFSFKSFKKIKEYKGWFKFIKKNTLRWNINKFKKSLKNIKGLRLQESSKQDMYKLSYYVDLDKKNEVLNSVKKIIRELCSDAEVVYSEDYPEKRGLLDILPKIATKKGALDYLIEKLKLDKSEVLFCGDSGNDYLMLVSGYNAVLVKNSPENIKKKVKAERKKQGTLKNLYVAKNQKKIGLNGNYVSGIIQGLRYFGIN